MLQCGLFRSNFAFAISPLSLPKNRHKQRLPYEVANPSKPAANEVGAGDGNRTHVASLEGWCSTIELHPPGTRALRNSPPTTTPVFRRIRRRRAPGGGGR